MKPSTKIENRFYIQQYHYLYNEIQFIYYENIYMDTACILLTFICFYACNSSHVYYLDATSGSNQNNGTSPRSAWQSIEVLKQISLQPGDKILLKKGETFSGILELTGKGTYTHPIIIDAYGEGNQKTMHCRE